MLESFSAWLDKVSNFFSQRKGLLPLIGIIFILLNLILQFVPVGWLSQSNLLLHVGTVVAILGILLAKAL
jgi:hypothetical protein